MSQQISIDEQLSALTDGELERGTARFLMRRIENDPPLAQRFERYQLVRACLRREYKGNEADAFAAGVMARIEAEDAAAQADMQGAHSPWLKRALGGAIAASVAGLVLFASMQQPRVEEAPTLSVAKPPVAAGLTPNLVAQPVAGRSSVLLPQPVMTDPRIEAYLVRHSGAVATMGHSGALPYAYAVGLDTRPTVAPAPQQPEDPNVRRAAADGGKTQ